VRTPTFLVMCALILTAATPAWAGSIQLRTVVEKEIETVDENGETRVHRVPADQVIPGDEVIYTIRFQNIGTEPAGDVRITDPIPVQMIYKIGSASGPDADVLFSVDGGKTLAPADRLTVLDDGGNPRPPVPEEFTHVQWVLKTPVVPGGSGEVSFRAQLK